MLSNRSFNSDFEPKNSQEQMNSSLIDENNVFIKESMKNMDEAIRSLSPLNRMTTEEIRNIGIANRFNFS